MAPRNVSYVHTKVRIQEPDDSNKQSLRMGAMCSKHFRVVSEQRKTEKRTKRNGIFGFARAKNGTRTPFFARSLTLVPRSLF